MNSWQTFDAIPTHCQPQGRFLEWLSTTFHTCVPTPLSMITTILGSVSFVAWLFAQLPQIYKNYRLKSTAGLSIFFLIEWLLGDTTNLAGAILTEQASWQILIASYYTFVDCVMVIQYFYYTHYNAQRPEKTGARQWDGRSGNAHTRLGRTMEQESSGNPSSEVDASKPEDVPFGAFTFLSPFSSSPREKGTPHSRRTIHRIGTGLSPAPSPKTVLFLSLLLAVASRASPIPPRVNILEAPHESSTEIAGRFISWASTLLYLGSRLPQIYKNAHRRSTSGLSLSLFVAAFFGNLFYSASLLTNPLGWASYSPYGHNGWAGPNGSDRKTWVLSALPFWLGAAGVLALDLTIGIQFMMYDKGANRASVVMRVKDSEGREGWWKVSGWMRGWVPSPSAGDRTKTVDDQRPLLARDEPEGGVRAYGT